ncbi:MAG: Fe-S-cluster containining protein [Glaciecola sp.]|jgi:Fe-S-cluster containining protein
MTHPEPPEPQPKPQSPSQVDSRWYRDGLSFSCTACGNCCKSNGDYSHVYITPPEIQILAAFLDMGEAEFQAKHVKETDGWSTLNMPGPKCEFLDESGLCSVYEARPKQCRTWPFWEENLRPGVWQGPMKEICPGLDTGPHHTADQVDAIAKANEEWYESNGGLD